MAPTGNYIGVDLGTSKTCVAILRGNREVSIVPHEGQPYIPSYVAFTDTGRLIGLAAKNQAGINPENTIFGTLRFVGRRYTDRNLQGMVELLPFRVVDKDGSPAFSVHYRGDTRIFTPLEILSMILSRAKKDAEAFMGGISILGAVITVPIYFNSCQRQVIRDAASIAGLATLQLINAPTAALRNYVFTQRKNMDSDPTNVIVVDVGAGTCDVVLASITPFDDVTTIIEERSVAGIFNAGEDLDTRLTQRQVEIFKKQWGGDPTVSRKALGRLRIACEVAKRELSSCEQAVVEIEQLRKGYDHIQNVTKSVFEELCGDMLQSLLGCIERVLSDYGFPYAGAISVANIRTIFLVGGSVRIPRIQQMLSEYFDGKEVSKTINPDEAAARGAALIASFVSEEGFFGKTLVTSVIPITVGIETSEGLMSPLIKRNTTFPTKMSLTYTTTEDNPKAFLAKAFEGEHSHTKDNLPLGSLLLLVNSYDAGCRSNVEVTMDIDNDMSIRLITRAKNSFGCSSETLLQNFPRVSPAELELMGLEAKQLDLEDQMEQDRIEARNAAEDYAHCLLGSKAGVVPSGSNTYLKTLAGVLLRWIDEHQTAPAVEYLKRLHQVKDAAITFADESPDSTTVKVHRSKPVQQPRSDTKSVCVPEPPPDVGSPDPDRESSKSCNGSIPEEVFDVIQSEAGRDGTYQANRPISSQPATRAFASPPLSPIASEPSMKSETPSSDTSFPSAETVMTRLFSNVQGGRSIYTDIDFMHVSTYLRNTGRQSWSRVPRLYTVLRQVGQLEMLDSFIGQGITDIWFPFALDSLPSALPPSARAQFIKRQEAVLSKSLLFETSSDRRHAHFGRGEPLPFQVVARLGAGAHGQVDKVLSTVSHRIYARKLFRKTRGVPRDAIRSFLVELEVLKRVQHVHCIELVQSYTDPRFFALIMSPVGDCNLWDYYDVARTCPDKLSLLRSFFGCLANALQYIHNTRIRHRDIKPQNIVVTGDRALLTDFGVALDWEGLSRSTTTADSGKTWPYAAPEVVRYDKRNTAADVWSMGCVFMEMASVVKGETVTAMRDFFKEHNENYFFYANVPHLQEWANRLRLSGSSKDDAILEWVLPALQEEAVKRPTAAELYDTISATCAATHVPFCGPCCLEDIGLSDFEDDEEGVWKEMADLTVVGGNV